MNPIRIDCVPHDVIPSPRLRALSCLLAALALAACGQPAPEVTPGPSATPRPTATAVPTSTPTPTATPTAQALRVSDDLRAVRSAAPAPQRGAPCGVVDMLDFPVGAPDGAGFGARWSFGRLSSRYNGIHAGEDWRRTRGDSLGQPVYAIGHGTVTYAQPLGWGVDRGVVIVRHVFADGKTVLSFYGHLDPPSVVLRPGDCVARGDQVGAIGKPRGSPHLHFEIRNHTPDAPGPGYWPVDPRLAGWFPPTQYIWDYRIATSPGVQWTQPFTATDSSGVGVMGGGLLAAVDGQALIGLDAADGQVRWRLPLSGTVSAAVIDPSGSLAYLATLGRSLQAVDASGALLWQRQLGDAGRAALMPLPGGGVVAHIDGRLLGVSDSGSTLWQIDGVAPPADWQLSGDRLLFTTDAEHPVLHSIDRAGDLRWAARVGGRLAVSGDRVFIYNAEGVHALDPERLRADLVTPLDGSLAQAGRMVAAPGGGVIVAHRGRRDLRLMWIDAAGTLRWDRSVSALTGQPPLPFVVNDSVYLLTAEGDVLSIAAQDGTARRVFDGGGADRLGGAMWAFAASNGRALFDFRGGAIVAFDPNGVLVAAGGTP